MGLPFAELSAIGRQTLHVSDLRFLFLVLLAVLLAYFHLSDVT